MFLARRITRAKWGNQLGIPEGQIAADAVTADLRTRDNELSFWECGSASTEDVEEAVLALAAGGDRLDKVEVVWLAKNDLVGDALQLSNSRGRTPVQDLADRHVDLQHLDYERLGRVAAHVSSAIEEHRYRRLTRQEVKVLLLDAIKSGRLRPSKLAQTLAKALDG